MNPFCSVPWNTIASWQEANSSLSTSLKRNRSGLTDCRRHAGHLRHLLEGLFPLMEDLCRQACPDCADICCQRAWVWVDFKDLLFMHLAEIALPPQQLLGKQGDRCRYVGHAGCSLDRLQRPFICTWYLCPAQSRLLDRQPAGKQHLSQTLEQIKDHRKRIEASYIQAVV
jgi:hypothetical protein